MTWLTRSSIPRHAGKGESPALLFAADTGASALPVTAQGLDLMRSLGAQTLRLAGVQAGTVALCALNTSAAPGVGIFAEALAAAGAQVVSADARGRLRLLQVIRGLRPDTLVTTPCGALDFLARLYMEFNVDPLELDLKKIILVGEIASPGAIRRLHAEFEAEVVELYCDPVFFVPLACRRGQQWQLAEPGIVQLGAIDEDQVVSAGLDWSDAQNPLEIIVNPVWCAPLRECWLRTGQVVRDNRSDAGAFDRTVGGHVLIRGRWVELARLEKELGLIDGIVSWTLAVERGQRSLDFARLQVRLEREGLVANPMWLGRLREAVKASTPIQIDVVTEQAGEGAGDEPMLRDLRGHHLGAQRAHWRENF